MTSEERISVRHMINQTIERLQKASVGANQIGSRYSRLLQLLWRKAIKCDDPSAAPQSQNIDSKFKSPQDPATSDTPSNFHPNNFNGTRGMNNVDLTPSGPFSWLDLDATWNFATQNNSVASNADELYDAPVDMEVSFLTDYLLLEGDNPGLIF
jgi:hypothetical protein